MSPNESVNKSDQLFLITVIKTFSVTGIDQNPHHITTCFVNSPKQSNLLRLYSYPVTELTSEQIWTNLFMIGIKEFESLKWIKIHDMTCFTDSPIQAEPLWLGSYPASHVHPPTGTIHSPSVLQCILGAVPPCDWLWGTHVPDTGTRDVGSAPEGVAG